MMTENENLGANFFTGLAPQLKFNGGVVMRSRQFQQSDRYKILHMTQHLF